MASIVEQDPDIKDAARPSSAPDISHWVHKCQLDAVPRLALCGYDCSDRQVRTAPTSEVCVVCDSLRAVRLASGSTSICQRCI